MQGAFDWACARLFAISDLPEDIANDDGALPYPEGRPGPYTEYQKLMRLDFDTALLGREAKAAQLAGALALHNHHSKGIEDRRQRIIEAIRPGRRGDSLPTELSTGTKRRRDCHRGRGAPAVRG